MNEVLAFHIIWTTYGTWLPGDARGWVRKKSWDIQPPDPDAERKAQHNMTGPAVLLTDDQRAITERTIANHCRLRGWTLHAVNARNNHVHVVVTADRDPETSARNSRHGARADCRTRLDYRLLREATVECAGSQKAAISSSSTPTNTSQTRSFMSETNDPD